MNPKVSKTTRFLGVDPGTKTGLSYVEVPDMWMALAYGDLMTQISRALEVKEVRGSDYVRTAGQMMEWIVSRVPDVLVVEDFRLFRPEVKGGWTSDPKMLDPVRLISVLEWELANHPFVLGNVELLLRMPGTRTVATQERMKRWGLWRTERQGGGKDANAATQHLIVEVRKRYEAMHG